VGSFAGFGFGAAAGAAFGVGAADVSAVAGAAGSDGALFWGAEGTAGLGTGFWGRGAALAAVMLDASGATEPLWVGLADGGAIAAGVGASVVAGGGTTGAAAVLTT
jgi:hypothetical protein